MQDFWLTASEDILHDYTIQVLSGGDYTDCQGSPYQTSGVVDQTRVGYEAWCNVMGDKVQITKQMDAASDYSITLCDVAIFGEAAVTEVEEVVDAIELESQSIVAYLNQKLVFTIDYNVAIQVEESAYMRLADTSDAIVNSIAIQSFS